MTHRIRMARKRLMVAREGFGKSLQQCCANAATAKPIWLRLVRQYRTLRAIEQRKDKTA